MAGCFSFATLYESGQGLTQNFQRAAQLHREACEDGYGEACFRLAGLYDKGAGVVRSPDRATSFKRRACQLGYADACAVTKS
jgi:TPR repeat protein